jgi:hypothetical protein
LGLPREARFYLQDVIGLWYFPSFAQERSEAIAAAAV